MEVLAEIAAMRLAADRARASGARIGLVPTMGALHEGHLSLVRHVRARTDLTVVSIFVNPTQFGPDEDLSRYPRNLQRDCELLAAEGVDLVFAPPAEAMYPVEARTFVEVAGMSDALEGRSRPGHFRGVTTVVAKLFGIVAPHLAAFGQKDAQQAVIIRRMVADLMMGVEVVVLPTCRDEDGVALSSRNVYLSTDERRAARAIPGALDAARTAWQLGERDPAALVAAARATIENEPLLRAEYVALVAADSLEPATRAQAEAGTGLLLTMAVFVGATRLIDNTLLGA
jgi:pantoate--beta-alanine ligase